MVLRKGFGSRLKAFPFELQARGLENAHRRSGHFRPDAIAGNQCDLVCHVVQFSVPPAICSDIDICSWSAADSLGLATFWPERRALSLVFSQLLQLRHELLDVLEIEIDGGKPDVGDFVVAPQPVHDQFPDFAGLAFPLRRLDHEAFGLVDDLLQLADRHRPLLAGPQQPVQNFLTVEFFPPTVLFHHHVGNFIDALVRGKAFSALQAFPAAADGIGFLALARIHHFVIRKPAKRTLHALGCSSEFKTIVAGDAASDDMPGSFHSGSSWKSAEFRIMETSAHTHEVTLDRIAACEPSKSRLLLAASAFWP